MPNRHGPSVSGIMHVKVRSGSRASRSISRPKVRHIGKHSLPDVWRRPMRRLSRSGMAKASAFTPAPRKTAAMTSDAGPIQGIRAVLPAAFASANVTERRASDDASFGAGREAPACRSYSTQYRNASSLVLVPASPAWPSVSITAKGLPLISYAKRCKLKLSGPHA